MREQRIDNRAVHTGSLILVDAGHPFRQPAAEQLLPVGEGAGVLPARDRKSTRLNSSHR